MTNPPVFTLSTQPVWGKLGARVALLRRWLVSQLVTADRSPRSFDRLARWANGSPTVTRQFVPTLVGVVKSFCLRDLIPVVGHRFDTQRVHLTTTTFLSIN